MTTNQKAWFWTAVAAIATVAGAIGAIFGAINSGWDFWDRYKKKDPSPEIAKPVDTGTAPEVFPLWQVGDRWSVQTRPVKPNGPVAREWRLHVAGKEHLPEGDCFKLDLGVLLGDKECPAATLWVGGKPSALRQSQLIARGGTRRLTETYRYPAGNVGVVQPLLTELPIALPAELGDGLDNTAECFVKPGAGPEFLVTTQTKQKQIEPSALRHALGADPPGNNPYAATFELNVQSAGLAKLRMLWRQGDPWPVFADNGVVTARLTALPARLLQEKQPPGDGK